jgi:Putative zinc dependent peptidase (DUF5700)
MKDGRCVAGARRFLSQFRQFGSASRSVGRALFLVLAAVAIRSAYAADSFHLKIDASQASAVLRIIDRGATDGDIEAVSRTAATQASIAHTAFFDPRGSVQAWKAGLRAAAAGTALQEDPFRFDQLRHDRTEATASIERIGANPDDFAARIERLIAPYMPANLALQAQMRLVAGTRATGWTEENADVFYFNIGKGEGDLRGIATIAAHELYHLVLAHMLPRPRFSAAQPLGRVERVLLNGVDEGMASHVGRFNPRDRGRLTQRNVEEDRNNEARRPDNWALLNALIIAARHSADVTPEVVHRIAFAGAYDEPGYYVFRDMAEQIEAAAGRPALLELVRRPPAEFVLAYESIASHRTDLPRFSSAAISIIHSLAAAESADGESAR